MTLAQRKKPSIYSPPTQQTNKLLTLPSAVGGLNARDNAATMPPTCAIILENFYPSRYGCQVRRGWKQWFWDMPGASRVESLIKYNAANGTQQMFAARRGSFVNVTISKQYAVTDVVAGFGTFLNDRWQFTQLANITGTYTVAVNGADVPKKYDGAVWDDCALTANMTTYPEFDAKKLIHVVQMHRRLWFTERDSSRIWYLPVDEIQGEVKLFGLGEVFPRGGFLQCAISWSVDTGAGMDDLSVFISSRGNVAVFRGFDPDNAPTDFGLVGVYQIGATFSRRCAATYGSDVAILCEDGVVLLSTILAQSKMLMQPPLTDIIQHLLSDEVNAYSKNFGWELIPIPRHNQFYINVPVTGAPNQLVMNSILEVWTRFIGYQSFCWALFNDEPFFGGTNYVGQAWVGGLDNPDPVTNEGVSIDARCLQAFSNFGGAQQKIWNMARPAFVADELPRFVLTFNTDYNVQQTYTPIPPSTGTGIQAEWDTGIWDEDDWSGEQLAWSPWVSLHALGFVGSVYLRTSTTSQPVTWVSTDFILISGGAL